MPAVEREADAEPAGYILPIRRRQHDSRLRWSSQLWFPRPTRLLLSPGDSPIGYRIPTEAMPWVAPDEIQYQFEADPIGGPGSSFRLRRAAHDLFAKTPPRSFASPFEHGGKCDRTHPSLALRTGAGWTAACLYALCFEARGLSRSASPRLKIPASICKSRSGWRVILHRSIRGCDSSASLPILASSRSTCPRQQLGRARTSQHRALRGGAPESLDRREIRL